MFKNYFKIAWRNLWNNKVYSAINILGLSMGLAIALLIGLWVWDEISFNRNFVHYDRLVTMYHNSSSENEISTYPCAPYPLASVARLQYGADFKAVALVKRTQCVLAAGEHQILGKGYYAEVPFMDLLNVKMEQGHAQSLGQPTNLLISASMAKMLFGNTDPINKVVKIDNKRSLQISGVYKDFPANCDYNNVQYMMPWQNIALDRDFAKYDIATNNWGDNSYNIIAQLQDNVSLEKAESHIKGELAKHVNGGDPTVVLHPANHWHLYADFKNGVNAGGAIQFVWMFGIIGLFVLLLACINFMNLSTARSEKRAKEVGIRKSSGSLRSQLISQFLIESIVMAALAMSLSLLMTALALPWFNQLADKEMSVQWGSLFFWGIVIAFTVCTGVVAGSYPAFYLSAFNPVKILKGGFKAGRFAALPRKVLVVLQFTVSVALVVCTAVIYQQIRYVQNRPVGYNRNGLLQVNLNTPDFKGKYEALRHDLLQSGAVTEMAESSSPVTDIWMNWGGFAWQGMPDNMQPLFGIVTVTTEYGKAVGWKMAAGRDFSSAFGADYRGIVANEAAVKYMKLKDPVGQTIRWSGSRFADGKMQLIGVVKDVIMESPNTVVKPTLYMIDPNWLSTALVRLSPGKSIHETLPVVEKVFKQYNPHAPFDYSFADSDYAAKFKLEERIGTLAAIFAVFAGIISCMGLFGLASFIAAQRTKEIGIRKVLGASVANLWGLLSKDFVLLVLLASALALPMAYFSMQHWLLQYEYRTHISSSLLIMSVAGAMLVTLLTVSFQAVKAALLNPVRSLRSE